MPEIPGGRAVRVFAAPLAAYAAALSDLPEGEPTLEASMWRVLVMCMALTALTWFASAADNERGGRWATLAGISMTAITAGALSFATALSLLVIFARSFDALIVTAAVFFAVFLAGISVFLTYINSVITGLHMRTVAAATAVHCVVLTALMLEPHRSVALSIAACAAAACIVSFVHDRRSAKKRPV